TVTGIVLDDLLERALDRQVVAVLLVVNDLATREGRLGEVVQQLFLLEIQLLEARNLVAEDSQVRESLRLHLKVALVGRVDASGRRAGAGGGGGRLRLLGCDGIRGAAATEQRGGGCDQKNQAFRLHHDLTNRPSFDIYTESRYVSNRKSR